MRFFPRIKSPCPYKGDRADIMDGDVCKLCHKEVHDLTDMSEADKEALLADCDDLCVSYRIDRRLIAATVAVGAGVLAPAIVIADANSLKKGSEPLPAQQVQAQASATDGDDIKTEFYFGGI